MIAVYYSLSGNTEKIAKRLSIPAIRVQDCDPKVGTEEVILLLPTYSDARGRDAIPKEITRFVQDINDSDRIKAVVACGDRAFINTFCLGGRMVADTLGVPVIATPEISGRPKDITAIERFVEQWK